LDFESEISRKYGAEVGVKRLCGGGGTLLLRSEVEYLWTSICGRVA